MGCQGALRLLPVSALLLAGCAVQGAAGSSRPDAARRQVTGLHLPSLASLSVETLRARSYGSTLTVEAPLESAGHDTFLASFQSDGLREYARVDLPVAAIPGAGYPVVVFLHGWVGIKAAPGLDFYATAGSDYNLLIKAYVAAGFVVVTPGFRGHGTVNGVPADGIEYLAAWDNGSYVSPAFYAIDALNLIEGLNTLETVDWAHWHRSAARQVRLDLHHVNVVGHSQGGDVALIALAAASAGSSLHTTVAAGSIWSGCFPRRLTQLATYGPMESSPQAFLSGDGTWNGTPIGADGSVNANFIFGYPPDWIDTPDAGKWTWQRDSWSKATVAEALRKKLDEMYGTLNAYVDNIHNAVYHIQTGPNGKAEVVHDSRVASAIERIGAFDRERFLTMPLSLHHSDRDFYSFAQWNADLCARINRVGGKCSDFQYPGNTHVLRVSPHSWFSGDANREGFGYMIRRDIARFRGENPTHIPFP